MAPHRRDVLKAGGIAALGALGGKHVADAPVSVARGQSEATTGYPDIRFAVHQDSEQTVNWVVPAKRRLDEFAFGTSDEPVNTDHHWENVTRGRSRTSWRNRPTRSGSPKSSDGRPRTTRRTP